MEKVEQVFKDCNSNHVFKKCHDKSTGHDCIVMLEKPSIGFICNESRKSVINKDMAKFRCNGLNVMIIYDLVSRETVDSVNHAYWTWRTNYKVGELVKPNWFDDDLDTTCTSGIHYFLTLEAAMAYDREEACCIISDGRRFGEDGDCYPDDYAIILDNLQTAKRL
jgi:hypothetical protein